MGKAFGGGVEQKDAPGMAGTGDSAMVDTSANPASAESAYAQVVRALHLFLVKCELTDEIVSSPALARLMNASTYYGSTTGKSMFPALPRRAAFKRLLYSKGGLYDYRNSLAWERVSGTAQTTGVTLVVGKYSRPSQSLNVFTVRTALGPLLLDVREVRDVHVLMSHVSNILAGSHVPSSTCMQHTPLCASKLARYAVCAVMSGTTQPMTLPGLLIVVDQIYALHVMVSHLIELVPDGRSVLEQCVRLITFFSKDGIAQGLLSQLRPDAHLLPVVGKGTDNIFALIGATDYLFSLRETIEALLLSEQFVSRSLQLPSAAQRAQARIVRDIGTSGKFWKDLGGMMTLLKPFVKAARLLASASDSPASLVYPTMKTLAVVLRGLVDENKPALDSRVLRSIVTRFHADWFALSASSLFDSAYLMEPRSREQVLRLKAMSPGEFASLVQSALVCARTYLLRFAGASNQALPQPRSETSPGFIADFSSFSAQLDAFLASNLASMPSQGILHQFSAHVRGVLVAAPGQVIGFGDPHHQRTNAGVDEVNDRVRAWQADVICNVSASTGSETSALALTSIDAFAAYLSDFGPSFSKDMAAMIARQVRVDAKCSIGREGLRDISSFGTVLPSEPSDPHVGSGFVGDLATKLSSAFVGTNWISSE